MLNGNRVVVVYGCSLTACHMGAEMFVSDFPDSERLTLSFNLVFPGGGAAEKIFSDDVPLPAAQELIDAFVLVGHDNCHLGTKKSLRQNVELVLDLFPKAEVAWYWLNVIEVDPKTLPISMYQNWRWN